MSERASEHIGRAFLESWDRHLALAQEIQMIPNGTVPRRNNMQTMWDAEKAILAACAVVEQMPADIRLTDAVNLLQAARASVADFIDGVQSRRLVTDATLPQNDPNPPHRTEPRPSPGPEVGDSK